MCSNISSVFLGGNRLDGGLHGAPREHDALHAQVGFEFLLCSLLLFFAIVHQALVVFFGVVRCHFDVCHCASSPCCIIWCCSLSFCCLSLGIKPLLCSLKLLFAIMYFVKWGSVPVVFSAVVIYQIGNMVSTQSCCLPYTHTLLFSSVVGIEEKRRTNLYKRISTCLTLPLLY